MKKLLIAILCIGAFCGASYIEHHYTREQCEVIQTTADSTIFKDKQGYVWAYNRTGYNIGDTADLKMHDNKTVSNIKDDKITKITNVKNSTTRKKLRSIGIYTITAYCPCRKCSEGWGRKTASGATAKANHTIAAPKNIPFGTILVIDGIEYTVEDRGGAIKGKRLDMFFNTHAETLKWGKKKIEVFMYE